MIAVLCARRDSIYKTIPGLDVYDADRGARTFPGGYPAIAHPPCRGWGAFSWRSKHEPEELELGIWCAHMVRAFGGVLEHPAHSGLWDAAGLPLPGDRDASGGWTLAAPQYWWGHRAAKETWFYIRGARPSQIPAVPFVLGKPSRRVDFMCAAEREKTPPGLAHWLVELALRCREEIE